MSGFWHHGLHYLPFRPTIFLSLSHRHYWCYKRKKERLYLTIILHLGLCFYTKERDLYFWWDHKTSFFLSSFLFFYNSFRRKYFLLIRKVRAEDFSFFIKFILLCTTIYCCINSMYPNTSIAPATPCTSNFNENHFRWEGPHPLT